MPVQNISSLHLPGIASNISNIDQCTPALCDINLYGTVTYVPSLSGNAIFGVLFASFLLVQLIFVCIYRTWSFSSAMVVGLLLEIMGYIGRIAMHYNVFNSNLFLVNIICLTIGPVFFTAAIYLTLARVIVHYGIHNSRLSPKTYTITFMTSDVIALILQSVGGGIADDASTKAGRNEGVHIMVAGLSFQVISLLLFMSLAAEFFLNVKKERSQLSFGKSVSPKGYKSFIYAFAVASILILVRSAYRVAELAHGFDGKLANNQPMFMIFESSVMVFALAIMTIFHPGRFIGRAGWKLSGWGKNANVIETKEPAAMETGNWNSRYGSNHPNSNRPHGPNKGDIYQRLELGEVNPYHSQVQAGYTPRGAGTEDRVRLMDRVE